MPSRAHVVVVERLAELLGRKQREADRAPEAFLMSSAHAVSAGFQRVLRRPPSSRCFSATGCPAPVRPKPTARRTPKAVGRKNRKGTWWSPYRVVEQICFAGGSAQGIGARAEFALVIYPASVRLAPARPPGRWRTPPGSAARAPAGPAHRGATRSGRNALRRIVGERGTARRTDRLRPLVDDAKTLRVIRCSTTCSRFCLAAFVWSRRVTSHLSACRIQPTRGPEARIGTRTLLDRGRASARSSTARRQAAATLSHALQRGKHTATPPGPSANG